MALGGTKALGSVHYVKFRRVMRDRVVPGVIIVGHLPAVSPQVR
jgi:hypothetical protein